MFLTTLRLLPYVAPLSDVFHFSQHAYTMARRTLMETCGTQFWGRCWNASCALVLTVSRTANASRAPANTRANILWNQWGSAARLVQVVKHGSKHNELFTLAWWWLAVNIIHTTSFCFFSLESKAESNQTQCYLGFKNSLLVYKVESSSKVDSPDTVRIIAVERQSTAEVEVQVWNTVEGTVTTGVNYIKGTVRTFLGIRIFASLRRVRWE